MESISSFSPEFFLAEGEPYDRSNLALDKDGNPISVYSAICLLKEKDPERWKTLAEEEFEVPAEMLTADAVYERALEIDTCGDSRTPVDVWLDAEGWITVDVYDGPEVSID